MVFKELLFTKNQESSQIHVLPRDANTYTLYLLGLEAQTKPHKAQVQSKWGS